MTAPTLDAIIGAAVADAVSGALEDLAAVAGPRAYSVTEVAERLDVSPQTVYRLIADGHLAAVPHLRPTRIAGTALEAFLARDDDGTP